MAAPTRVRIFHPADPLGTVPGGIETFIRGIIRWAPSDIDVSLVGISTDPARRPPARWTVCDLGKRTFSFFPLFAEDAGVQRGSVLPGLPLSLRFCLRAISHLRTLRQDFDILEVHRVEPALLFQRDARPVNGFFHQDREDLRNPRTENGWRHLPSLYFRLEDRLVPRFQSVYCVRESTAAAYQARYPQRAEHFRFMPTWMDPEIFHPPDPAQRQALRRELDQRYGIGPGERVIIFVGRLDAQKNVELLIRSFAVVLGTDDGLRLLLVGDGALAAELRNLAKGLRIADKVVFAGAQPVSRVADLLRSADVFAMASAYEGMSMSLLEAMGCGLPVVATDVGEVRRVVSAGTNGEIARGHTVPLYAEAVRACLANRARYAGKPAIEVASRFVPSALLGGLYETYRRLHGVAARSTPGLQALSRG